VSSHRFGSHGNPILLVIEVVASLEMPFFLAADYAAVGLDFSDRIKGGLVLTPGAVCELDVLVQR